MFADEPFVMIGQHGDQLDGEGGEDEHVDDYQFSSLLCRGHHCLLGRLLTDHPGHCRQNLVLLLFSVIVQITIIITMTIVLRRGS